MNLPRKPAPGSKAKGREVSIAHSSAAEYLTFIAASGQGGVEAIFADASKPHMGLTDFEVGQLSRLVNAYLDVAEDMAQRKMPMTMQDWELRLNRFIEATDREVLQDAGHVTAEIARTHAETEFEKYRIVQDALFESDFDRLLQAAEPKRLPVPR